MGRAYFIVWEAKFTIDFELKDFIIQAVVENKDHRLMFVDMEDLW